MSRILARDAAVRWAVRRDLETYDPARDGPRAYKTRWVIEAMRHYLPPEHIALARRLRDYAAKGQGLTVVRDRDRIDGTGNGTEMAMLGRLGAIATLSGYADAVAARLAARGRHCFRCIVEERTTRQTLAACGLADGSSRSVRQLVQLTLMAAHDHHEIAAGEKGA